MMTQRNYVDIAKMFNDSLDQYGEFHRAAIVHIIVEYAKLAKEDNARFNRDKFYRAAGVGHLADN